MNLNKKSGGNKKSGNKLNKLIRLFKDFFKALSVPNEPFDVPSVANGNNTY